MLLNTEDRSSIDQVVLEVLRRQPDRRLSAWEVKEALGDIGHDVSLRSVYDAIDRLATCGRVRVLDFSTPDDLLDLLVDEGHLPAATLDFAGHVSREAVALADTAVQD